MLDMRFGREPRIAGNMLQQENIHLFLRDWRHSKLQRTAEVNFGAVYFWRPVGNYPPATLIGEFRFCRVWKNHLADLREDAVGSDYQIEPRRCSVG